MPATRKPAPGGNEPATKAPGNRSPLADAAAFRRVLGGWFRRVGRDYPWRRTTDPYAILVSEVMLQQTQIATVLGRGYYDRWIERFPDPATLAQAPEDAVLKAWEGLGYYRRARNLQATARAIVDRHGGVFPDDPEAIRALPGVGRYTAGAILSFAWDRPAAIVDGNVARVLARLLDCGEPVDGPSGQRLLWEWAERIQPARRGARVLNSALMELGQRICTPAAPSCGACPVAAFCAATCPASLPRKRPRTPTVARDEFAVFACRAGRILLHRESGRRREGLWRLPERTRGETRGRPVLLRMRYGIMHFRVALEIVEAAGDEAPREGEAWHPTGSLGELAMPSPYRRALDQLLGGSSADRRVVRGSPSSRDLREPGGSL